MLNEPPDHNAIRFLSAYWPQIQFKDKQAKGDIKQQKLTQRETEY